VPPERPIVATRLPSGIWQRTPCGHSPTAFDDRDGCRGCTTRTLPCAVSLIRTTPTWTSTTTPTGLRRSHQTSVWAQLVVELGTVLFVEEQPRIELQATPTSPVVIVPGRAHHVVPDEHARFHIRFFELPG